MIYQSFQAYSDMSGSVRAIADLAAAALAQPLPGVSRNVFQRAVAALCEIVARAGLSHHRPAYRIDGVTIGAQRVSVREVEVHRTPFCTLLRFEKDLAKAQPRVLLVAPMSGHFATLLRGTVETMLADHDVYITDWHNARDVSLRHGHFGFDDFIDHLITFLQVLGAGTHVVAVCQPCVAVLAAAAIMAEGGDPAQPRSMTLMAGPIDARVNPDRGQHAGNEPAARVVRAPPDKRRPTALCGRHAQRLSRVRATCRLYKHEPRTARQSPD
jgi:poly(3-hydroxybutyrate) depolymerase